ncbi:P-loop containing nucleoside triphosphate hydrolase protein [Peniophora sp. CONT]|nr:P-loop containing nucleoside triphosphate hydrolase protein [Peniophora sp. CONT]
MAAPVPVPDAADIRVVTTIGHVDHGKTTLMDALLAANNIISSRMAGKIRYLDSREDEQERGITMESSAVSLRFKVLEKKEGAESPSPRTYAVNMIDTPGHVDFSSEVSTAARLVDGALVLVDAVEGVSSQTISVLRQAWDDRLKPILVVNKIDRLATELRMSPIEAYHHLSQLLEAANAVMGSFFAAERMEDDLRWREARELRLAEKKAALGEADDAAAVEDGAYEEKDDEDIYFAPERGNVVFASALGGWGFRVSRFAQLFAARLGMKEENLRRVLWGDFYLDPKTKRVIGYKHLKGRTLKPLFVQFVLENIWAIYDAILFNPNSDKVEKIVKTLNLKILPRDLKSKDSSHVLSTIFSQWLPLSSAIIQAIIDVVPPPSTSQRTRIPKMLYPDAHIVPAPKNKLETDLYACDASDSATVVAYVSKMFAVRAEELPENKKRPLTAEEMRTRAREAKEARAKAEIAGESTPSTETPLTPATPVAEPAPVEEKKEEAEEVLLGFARIYSGTLRIGTRVRAVLPKYANSLPPEHSRNAPYVVHFNIEALYTMMGRELVPVQSVTAGNVFAIRGLEGKVHRSATVCAPGAAGVPVEGGGSEEGWTLNLGSVKRQAPPIVRVALEPALPADMPALIRGMKMLAQADPCAETFQQATGEHVILTAGELHLERCLRDLRERFAKVEISASKPIVPFRETTVKGADMPPPKVSGAPRGTALAAAGNGVVSVTVRCVPLPPLLAEFLRDNAGVVRRLLSSTAIASSSTSTTEQIERAAGDLDDEEADVGEAEVRRPTVRPEAFWGALEDICKKVGGEWAGIDAKVWAVTGECFLVDRREGSGANSLKAKLAKATKRPDATSPPPDAAPASAAEQLDTASARTFDGQIETGFQIAAAHGPLCAEPMASLAFFVENVEVDVVGLEREGEQNRTSQISGGVISGVRDACRNGMLDWSPRLMLAMYECDIQASTDVLGKVYAVVARRRGRVVAEEMREGTALFNVKALLPVVESFGFADDIRKRTSGAASPQLVFAGYEMLDQDPFWVPSTEEELEDLGEHAERANVARVYMDGVRDRKGMFVHRKIVERGEGQRTLKR